MSDSHDSHISNSPTWCEACRDHFPEDHYDDDQHKVGPEYGPTGWEAFVIRAVFSGENDSKTVADLRAALEAARRDG